MGTGKKMGTKKWGQASKKKDGGYIKKMGEAFADKRFYKCFAPTDYIFRESR